MVLPLHDENHTFRLKPYVTFGLMAANIAVFMVQVLQGPNADNFIRQYALTPAEFTQRTDLPPMIPFPYWVTLFTAMFMHGGVLHLAFNMLYLRIFGDNLEDVMGHGRFLLFYLLCGLGGSWIYIFFAPDSLTPSLGSSGAIAGVLGGYLALFPKNRIHMLVFYAIVNLPAYLVIGFWAVIQLFSGYHAAGQEDMVGGVAYTAHVGGFLMGLLLTPFLVNRKVWKTP